MTHRCPATAHHHHRQLHDSVEALVQRLQHLAARVAPVGRTHNVCMYTPQWPMIVARWSIDGSSQEPDMAQQHLVQGASKCMRRVEHQISRRPWFDSLWRVVFFLRTAPPPRQHQHCMFSRSGVHPSTGCARIIGRYGVHVMSPLHHHQDFPHLSDDLQVCLWVRLSASNSILLCELPLQAWW